MAETVEMSKDITKGDKILVTVVSALQDIIVVSFDHGVKSFQGALLDATKRGLPCGVQPPEPIQGPDGDKLSTIAGRFTYFQEKKIPSPQASTNLINNKIDLRRNINPPARYKNARPTVRLRPRQVLCSNCRSICNEKNENVDVGKKRKIDNRIIENDIVLRRSERRNNLQQTDKISRSNNNDLIDNSVPSSSSIIQKITRIRSSKIHNDVNNDLHSKNGVCWLRQRADDWVNGGENKVNHCSTSVIEPSESSVPEDNASVNYRATPRRLSSSSVESAKIPEDDDNERENPKTMMAAADSTVKSSSSSSLSSSSKNNSRVSRKKRSIGSMEDLWDETIFDENGRNTRATPIIKISFGTEGEGTVLKIPSKMKNSIGESENENDESIKFDDVGRIDEDGLQEQLDPQKQNCGKDFACAKAAKRALKKAKREARRKMLGNGSGAVSPGRSPLGASPRYNPSYDPLSYHRRKHKVKHKKKHKEERKHKSQEDDGEKVSALVNALPNDESYTAIKEQCLKQKLSISLKRLNTNAYARCDYPVSNASSGCKSPGGSSEELSEPEQEHQLETETNENTPDFPSPTHPLALRLAATSVAHCLTASGRRMDVGDVVWGKIHGFPWWPGKVLSISISCKEDGTPSEAQAHVAWYGSSTCSLMSCDRLSPFLETFKARYNKKKRGPYKEAIRQAQSEARSQITPNSTNDVLKVCGSPREVNVLS